MTFGIDDDYTRYLEPREFARATALYADGWAIEAIAADCGLTVRATQSALGLVQWMPEPPADHSVIGGAV